MPRKRSLVVVLLLAASILTFSAIAQDKPAPESKKPESKAATTTRPTLMPEVALNDVSLFDAIDYLRDVDPTFQAVVAYGPGADRDKPPVIHELKLKNVTAHDVLEVIGQVLPFVSVETIELNRNQLVVIRINPDPNEDTSASKRRDADEPNTRMYPLRELIDYMCRDAGGAPDARKKARDGILSLLQAAILTEGTKGDVKEVTLNVHEPTETLIFKGKPRERALITQALDTLVPPTSEPAPAAEVKALRDEVRQLRSRVATIAGMYGEPPAPPTTRSSNESSSKQK